MTEVQAQPLPWPSDSLVGLSARVQARFLRGGIDGWKAAAAPLQDGARGELAPARQPSR